MRISPRTRTYGMVLALVLFAASLGFHTVILSRGDPSFLLGVICLLCGFGYFPWYANPLLALSVVFLFLRSPRWAFGTSALSLALAVSTVFIHQLPYNEAGSEAPVVGYGPGFFLWLGSIAVFASTCLLSSLAQGPVQAHPPERV